MKENLPVCIRLPKTWIEKLREIAREMSYKERREIKLSDLVREATKQKWGLKGQLPRH
jgi:hypothetical protein